MEGGTGQVCSGCSEKGIQDQDLFQAIKETATQGIDVSMFGIMGAAYGCGVPINLTYPPENGHNDEVMASLYGGTFPEQPIIPLASEPFKVSFHVI